MTVLPATTPLEITVPDSGLTDGDIIAASIHARVEDADVTVEAPKRPEGLGLAPLRVTVSYLK